MVWSSFDTERLNIFWRFCYEIKNLTGLILNIDVVTLVPMSRVVFKYKLTQPWRWTFFAHFLGGNDRMKRIRTEASLVPSLYQDHCSLLHVVPYRVGFRRDNRHLKQSSTDFWQINKVLLWWTTERDIDLYSSPWWWRSWFKGIGDIIWWISMLLVQTAFSLSIWQFICFNWSQNITKSFVNPNFSHRICIPIDTVYAVFASVLNQIFDHYYQRFRIICTLSHSALASLPFTCPVKTTRQQPQQTTIIIFRFHSTNQSVRPPTRPLPNEMSGKDKVARPAENNFSFKNWRERLVQTNSNQ